MFSKSFAAHLEISRGTQVEKHCSNHENLFEDISLSANTAASRITNLTANKKNIADYVHLLFILVIDLLCS